ncbi:MAG: hypothetical protein J0665_01170 [Deltaproteobacteria bacterium]|nr:hypothetical protein [Deltaproteobacteria bacterium]
MIKGQNIPQSSLPEVQKLDAKAYSIELQRHEAAYNHSNIHAPESDKETVVSVGVLVLGAVEKTTPIDADMIPVMDTADSNKIRKLSWTNIKATLKVYFDTLYAAASTVTFPGFGTTGSTACVGNDARLSDSRTPVVHNHTAANVTDFASVALSSAPAETATTIGALINGATAITAPDETDTIAMRNHTGGLLHKMTWAYVKSVLKTYFDTLYLNQNTTGSAAKLTTPRAINGVNFDGSAAITINAVDSTARALLAGAASQAFSIGTATIKEVTSKVFTKSAVAAAASVNIFSVDGYAVPASMLVSIYATTGSGGYSESVYLIAPVGYSAGKTYTPIDRSSYLGGSGGTAFDLVNTGGVNQVMSIKNNDTVAATYAVTVTVLYGYANISWL